MNGHKILSQYKMKLVLDTRIEMETYMRTVIFDMNGLMFDTGCIFAKAWDYAGEKCNEQELRKYTKEFLLKYYETNSAPVKKGLYALLNYLKNNNYKLAMATSSPKWRIIRRNTGKLLCAGRF